MSNVSYPYNFSSFLNNKVNSVTLTNSIKASSITKTLAHIDTNNNICYIWFDSALTAGEQTTLSSIVSAHDGSDIPVDYAKKGINRPPLPTDDFNNQVSIGDTWIDTANKKQYVCVSNTSNNAIWKETTNSLHASTHANGGSDQLNVSGLSGKLTDNQNTGYYNNGSFISNRANINFIPGSNTTIGVSDISASDRVDVTITATGGGSSGLLSAYTNITDGTITASATDADTIRFRSANNILTTTVGSNDPTYGDNLLLTVNQGNIDHGSITGLTDDDHTQYLLTNGSRTLTGSINMGSYNITNVGTIDGYNLETQFQSITNSLATKSSASTTIAAGNGLTGGGDLSTNRTIDIVAADSTITVNADSIQVGVITDTNHGSRSGGTLHSVATTSVAGFMSSADKTKLDGIATGAQVNPNIWATISDGTNTASPSSTADTLRFRSANSILTATVGSNDATYGDNLLLTVNQGNIDHGSISGLADDDHIQYLLVNGSRSMSSSLNMGGYNITNIGTVDGYNLETQFQSITNHISSTANPHNTSIANLVSGTLAQLNSVVSDADLVSTTTSITAGAGLTGGGDFSTSRTLNVVANADGSIVVNADDIQVGVISDTQHGSRSGGTLHSVATTSVAGFMSSTDKTKLDGVSAGAQVNPNIWSVISDGTNTASPGTTADTFRFRSANTAITTTIGSNDATYGDNLLLTFVPGNVTHSTLGSLTSSDDHTQYVHNATARTITAVHTFSPGSATAPFILSTNAQGQLVTGLNADKLDGQDGSYYLTATNISSGTLPSAVFNDTSHGSRSGGTLHSTVTNSLAGFMPAVGSSGTIPQSNGTSIAYVSELTNPQKVTVQKAAVSIGSRSKINFIEGSNVTITTTDDSANGKVDVTIASTGSGGGLSNAYVNITDGTTTATASSSDTIRFRSANSILTTTVGSNDATYGDNLLLTVNQGNIDHGSITGLTDDDHTQYLLTNGTRTLTGSLNLGGYNIANVGTVDGYNLETQFQSITDSLIVKTPTTRNIIAGNGLTGGGDLSADRTLNIAAADSTITVNADSIQVGVITDTNHGSRSGGTLHSTVTNSLAGFMPAVGVSGTIPQSNGSTIDYVSELTNPQKVTVQKSAVSIGSRSKINFIEGSNVTITTADNSSNGSVDVTITSSSSGGGSSDGKVKLSVTDTSDYMQTKFYAGSNINIQTKVPDSPLIAEYLFNEATSGNSPIAAVDTLGLKNLTYYNKTSDYYLTNSIGTGYYFSSGYAQGNFANLLNTQTFTLELSFVYANTSFSNMVSIWGTSNDILLITSGTELIIRTRGSYTNDPDIYIAGALSNGRHVAHLVFDSTADNAATGIKVYLDGVLCGSRQVNSGLILDSTELIIQGKPEVDYFSIYSKPFTQTEVTTRYSQLSTTTDASFDSYSSEKVIISSSTASATTSTAGLMSASDKTKVDQIVNNSHKITISSTQPTSPSTGDIWIVIS